MEEDDDQVDVNDRNANDELKQRLGVVSIFKGVSGKIKIQVVLRQ